MKRIIVTENPGKWDLKMTRTQLGESEPSGSEPTGSEPNHPELLSTAFDVVEPQTFLEGDYDLTAKNIKVINLCSSYQYQTIGYYVSLMAEARGQKVLPTTSTVMDFRFQALIKEDSQDFDEIIQNALTPYEGHKVEVTIFFGFTENTAFARIGTLLFNLYQSPFLKAVFTRKEKWLLQNLKPVNLRDLSEKELSYAREMLVFFLEGKGVNKKSFRRKRFDLAIMVSPEDPTPPSDPKALQKFIKAAEKVGFNTELITKNDYGNLTQYDALFIRETTNVNHHTYRFARKAMFEGLVVLDDPESILKCTNKVYLHELMVANKIPVPNSIILRKGQKNLKKLNIIYPLVLKIPDGSFSKGVKKVHDEAELKIQLAEFFKSTDLLIAQEFMPTEFDWRVGVLNGKPIYLCKYFMARNHWQIVNWKEGDNPSRLGRSQSLSIAEAPHGLIQIALKASALIGKGLYGVDIKQVGNKFYVIEVNDNPSIDVGVEDKVEKNQLYECIMRHMLSMVQNKL